MNEHLAVLNERLINTLILMERVADEVLVDAGPDYFANCTYTEQDLIALGKKHWDLKRAIKAAKEA